MLEEKDIVQTNLSVREGLGRCMRVWGGNPLPLRFSVMRQSVPPDRSLTSPHLSCAAEVVVSVGMAVPPHLVATKYC